MEKKVIIDNCEFIYNYLYPFDSETFYKFIAGKLPIIGVGGIFDGETAYEKIKCGASLLQLYTSLVFEGPFIASKINQELSYYLKKDGFENISDAVGIYNK